MGRVAPGLLASLLEPVPCPAVGVRTMTKAFFVPFLWGILTLQAVRACRCLCTGGDMAFREAGVLKLGFLRAWQQRLSERQPLTKDTQLCTLTLTHGSGSRF